MNMRSICTLTVGSLLSALLATSCGYRLGGLKPAYLQDKETAYVEMFVNHTVQPSLAVQFTTAMADTLQRDGTYSLAPMSSADFLIRGEIKDITRSSLRTNPYDSYLSSEVGLTVKVTYEIVERASGKVLKNGTVSGMGSNLNTSGNVQGAVDNALSSAARQAAENLVTNITMP